ncbi:hypothetical protein PR202_gb18145 [Eleusine coracana subsp. coracana]|uniref:Uncharacterized protein n=1 Tax=Eleusine coracana subsp. coracana TaxID=191504 RepID=A0AAV5F4U2_ELECO|nr:hypothetical protein PR202_gb18145 [Eleusine coracana subsp. coracana]
MLAMSIDGLQAICLTPQLSVHETAMDWDYHREDEQVYFMAEKTRLTDWLVECGDMLLKVDLFTFSKPNRKLYGGILEVYRLDRSVEPANSQITNPWAESAQTFHIQPNPLLGSRLKPHPRPRRRFCAQPIRARCREAAAAAAVTDENGRHRGRRLQRNRRRGNPLLSDLLDSLLHQIIPLLSSFRDLLAFIGTALGVLRFLPFHLPLASTSHLSTSDQILAIVILVAATSSTIRYPVASGSSQILQTNLLT